MHRLRRPSTDVVVSMSRGSSACTQTSGALLLAQRPGAHPTSTTPRDDHRVSHGYRNGGRRRSLPVVHGHWWESAPEPAMWSGRAAWWSCPQRQLGLGWVVRCAGLDGGCVVVRADRDETADACEHDERSGHSRNGRRVLVAPLSASSCSGWSSGCGAVAMMSPRAERTARSRSVVM